jgi:hypothetical protein
MRLHGADSLAQAAARVALWAPVPTANTKQLIHQFPKLLTFLLDIILHRTSKYVLEIIFQISKGRCLVLHRFPCKVKGTQCSWALKHM